MEQSYQALDARARPDRGQEGRRDRPVVQWADRGIDEQAQTRSPISAHVLRQLVVPGAGEEPGGPPATEEHGQACEPRADPDFGQRQATSGRVIAFPRADAAGRILRALHNLGP